MPAPLDPRWPHESRLNPLDRPDRRWRCHALEAARAAERLPGEGGRT